MIKKVGLIGLGTVGQGVLRTLKQNSSLITRRTSLDIKIKKICDVKRSLRRVAKEFSLPFTTDPYKIINDPDIDIVIELIGGIEPAYSLVKDSLKNKKSVVTANKALLAKNGKTIFHLAAKNNVSVGFEASVCGAIPIIKSVSEGLIGCQVDRIFGILNGTANYILHKMEKENINFQKALIQAQKKGLAEQNPVFDIEGGDTLHKLCILSYLCYGIWPKLSKVYTVGITKLSLLDILYAKELKYRIKLLAIAKRNKKSLDLRVHPVMVPMRHPLSGIPLAYNAITLYTHPAGELLFFGEGAGGTPTSSSVVSDIVTIASGNKGFARKAEDITMIDIKEVKNQYYLRCMIKDQSGALAKITKILARSDISISSVSQKMRSRGEFVPLIMITHEAKEKCLNKAIKKIDRLSIVKSPSQLIRIEKI
ncbi:MAG: homoserine dehydrogenase [Candidatus Omnitrophica bacterium]|nr:homoserine dehydrogenase [Candidatus Omnitrophota bacterium]